MGIQIEEGFVKEATVNTYIADLAPLAGKYGTVFSITVTPTVNEKGQTRGVAGETAKVQEGARHNGFTARIAKRETLKNGDLKIYFEVTELNKSPEPGTRGRKSADK